MTMHFIYLIGGLVVLFIAGELLVSGAVRVAYKFKVSKLVVGLTVVSIGTSAPELFVSLIAALNGHPNIAIGNVVGSNIANIALIIGLTSIFFPLAVNKNLLRVDYPVMLGASFIFLLLYLFGSINKLAGIGLLVLLASYTFLLVRSSRKATKANDEVVPIRNSEFAKAIAFILLGAVGLYFGSNWFLSGATGFARMFNLSDEVIGVTLVALGTSIPELVTSLMAAFRKHGDIALGNILGSNVFNIHAVLGITAIVKTLHFPENFAINIFWMLGVALSLIVPFYVFHKLNRLYGLILLAAYTIYIIFSFVG